MTVLFNSLNSVFLLVITIAYLFSWRKQQLELKKMTGDIDALGEALAKLLAEFKEVNETLEHSGCYKSTQIEYNLRKSVGLRGTSDVESMLKNIFGDNVKFRARTVNIESRTFADDIKGLDSDLLRELLPKMEESQKYRQAGAIKRELDRRET